MLRILAPTALLLVSGCAIVPDYIKPEAMHTSHVTQHFGDTTAQKGWNTVGAYAGWNLPMDGYLEVGDSYAFEMVDGRHEVFNARAGIKIPLK
jgi:hypothetical protein